MSHVEKEITPKFLKESKLYNSLAPGHLHMCPQEEQDKHDGQFGPAKHDFTS